MSGSAYKRDYIPRSEAELDRYVDRQPHLNGLIATNADPYTKALAREERILLARGGCSAYAAAGQHLLICASDVGGFNAVKPLIRAALDSDQVAYISLNLAGFAYTSFAGCELHNCFTRIEASGLTLAAKRSILFNLSVPPSSVVITPATYSGLEDSWLMSAKSIYGARHLVFVQDHWGSYSPSTAETVCQNADPVDLILCNDDSVARKIQGQQLAKGISISATGTGVLPEYSDEALSLLRTEARRKLGIGTTKKVLLVLGSYDKEQKGNSRESIRSILNELSTKSDGLVVVIRPHPADESFDPKYLFRGDFVGKTADFILGGVQQIDIDQARALADGVISFDSTETIVAWKLGKPAAFAQRHDNRASYDVYQDIITQSSGGIVLIPNENGADSLVSFLAKVASFKSTSRPCSTSDIGAKMLNEILRHS